MTRSEVADVLGVSEKTVARYVAAGRLPARYVRGKTGQQLNVDEADVMRLKTEMETPVEVSTASPPPAIQSAPNTTEPESVLARVLPAATENAIAPAPAMTLSALARIVRAVMEEEGQPGQAGTKGDKVQVPVESKLLLSLDEAVALSGVPRSQLNAARREGQLEARRIGRGYKVRRDDLEKFVASPLARLSRQIEPRTPCSEPNTEVRGPNAR